MSTATLLLVGVPAALTGCGSGAEAPDATGPEVAASGPSVPVDPGRSAVAISVSGPGDPRLTTLTCDPPGGTHPSPDAACSALDNWLGKGPIESPVDKAGASGGAKSGPPSASASCPLPRGSEPVLTVRGTWHGERLAVTVSRADCNGDWGALLAVIAPPNAMT